MSSSRSQRPKQATIDDLEVFVQTATLMLTRGNAPFTSQGSLRTSLHEAGVVAPSTWIHTMKTLKRVYGGDLISQGPPRLTALGMRVFLNARRVLAVYLEGRRAVSLDRSPEEVTVAASQAALQWVLAKPLALWLKKRRELAETATRVREDRRQEEARLVRLFERRLDTTAGEGVSLPEALSAVERLAARPPELLDAVIRVREQVFDDTVEDLRTGSVDLGIAAKPLQGSWAGVQYFRLMGGIETKLACGPGGGLPEKVRLSDLGDKPLCLVASDRDGVLAGHKLAQREGVDRLVVEHYSSAVALVLTGAVYGFLPDLPGFRASGLSFHEFTPAERLPVREIGVWVNPSLPMKGTTRHLLEFLAGEPSGLAVSKRDRADLCRWLDNRPRTH
jgi:DNA-binding transcriptional LysR family regulator